MKTVREVSRLAGVSVRTLHHYDAIGLLKPTKVTDAGYRLYDENELSRLQTILLFRELKFPLAEIRGILESPNFDEKKAIRQQIELLEMQQKRIGNLISLARKIIITGGKNMDFSAFDKTKIEEYSAKAKEMWGETMAYKEYEQKTKGQTADEAVADGNMLMSIFSEIGQVKHLEAGSMEVQEKVEKLRKFITDNYYMCTLEIFRGLGQMYAVEGSMMENIDKAGGLGTAEFANKAIEIYCDREEKSGK